MNLAHLSQFVNHLWQSTVFAGVAGLMTFVLRRNRARVRLWVWMAASCKFLIPLSMLVALGGRIPWRAAPDITLSILSIAMDEMTQPFTNLAISPSLPTTAHSPASPIAAVLLCVWTCGFLGITCSWWVRWKRIRAAVRAGSPLQLAIPLRAISSSTLMEPGVFGVFRPVLMLPKGISSGLTPAQLQAILAHELCHVHHRDNLLAAIHMLVESLFWFHPLVWWIGKRIVEERERACDEEVLRQGGEAQVYAEAILNVCKLYLGSPLGCVSGVTGSDLKKRIGGIMSHRAARGLNFGRRLLLASAGIACVAAPITFGMLGASLRSSAQSQSASRKLEFEVASIKPSRPGGRGGGMSALPGGQTYHVQNMPVMMIFKFLYRLTKNQVSGEPRWLDTELYDIDAKAATPSNADDLHVMFQNLLTDRFKLEFHKETKELPVYALMLDKSGLKMKVNESEDDFKIPIIPTARGKVIGTRVSMSDLRWFLSQRVDRPVIDKTGLDKKYDFTLEWAPEPPRGGSNEGALPETSDGPTIFTALREQIGLKLVATKGPVEIYVIDHVAKPSEN